MKTSQSAGSVIFLILIAVALFAALTYAVMRQGGGTGGMDKEKANIAASEVMGYTQAIAQHINRMMSVYGVSESDLDPGYTMPLRDGTTQSDAYGNSNCASNKCRIFVDKGGEMQTQFFGQYSPVSSAWLSTWPAMGTVDFIVLNVNGVGSSAPDIAVRIAGISYDVCNAAHRKLGLPEETSAIETGTFTRFYTSQALTELNGSTTAAQVVGVSNTAFKGKTSFCHFHASGWANFIHVVLAR